MPASVDTGSLGLTALRDPVAFGVLSLPAGVFVAGATGSVTAVSLGLVAVTAGRNLPVTVIDPVTALLTGINCPAVPIYPLTGDRYYDARVYL